MTPRAIWENFKGAALQRRDEPRPHAKLAAEALDAWASAPSDASREERELRCASIVGALTTDFAIEKLAQERRITPEEQEYLLNLNAEAALVDLATLTKRADFRQHIVNGLASLAQHPKTTGAVIGGVVGGGIGAWKDEDNRLRGAALYAVPGAVIGGIGGALGGEHLQHYLTRSVADDARAQAHHIAQGAQPLIKEMGQDALALTQKRLEGVTDRATRATIEQGRERRLPELEAFDAALHSRAQARELAPTLEAAADSAAALAQTRTQGTLDRLDRAAQVRARASTQRAFDDFDKELAARTQAAHARTEAEAAQVAHEVAHNADQRARALIHMRQRETDAKHLHNSYLQAAYQVHAHHPNPDVQAHALEIADHLRGSEDLMISHAMAHPGQLHPEYDVAHYDKPGALAEIRQLAERIRSRGIT